MTRSMRTGSRSDWLVGGGELGELIRSLDWSTTLLGPREGWGSALRAVVNLTVGTRMPMALLWGRDLLLLYNDAYREIAGERHPFALGRSSREVWPEVWHINEPIFDAVMHRGESVYLENALFPIDREGRRRDALFTLCYSPVRIEDGTISGVTVIVQDTTAQMAERGQIVAERQLALDVFERGEACVVLDRDFRIVLVNERQELISKKPRGSTVGKLIWDVWPELTDPSNPFHEACLRAIRDGRGVTLDAFFPPLLAWLHARVFPIADGRLAAFFHDATARKSSEDELRASEERFRALTLASSDVLYRMSPDWREMRNLSSGKFLAETTASDSNWTERYILPEDRAQVQSAIDEAIRTAARFDFEHRVVSRDGEVKWTHSSAIPLKDPSGNVVEWFGVASDITARKHAEEELRASSADARARARDLEQLAADRQLALDAARMGWWHYDPRNERAWYDERYSEIFGVPGSERANEELLALIHPEDLPRVWAAVAAALDPQDPRHYSAEYRIRTPAGVERWIEAHGAARFEGSGSARRATSLVGTVTDVTERRRIEQEIRQREADLARAQAAAHLGSWRWDLRRDRVTWSDELYRIFGVDPLTFVPSDDATRKLIHSDDRERLARLLARALEGSAVEAFETRIVRRDGVERTLLASGIDVERDAGGAVVALLGTLLDVTETARTHAALVRATEDARLAAHELDKHRLHLEELVRERTAALERANVALEQQAAEVADLYERAPCGYHSLAPDGTILMVNDRELELLGYAREEFVGRNILEFMTPHSVALFRERYALFMQNGSVRDLDFEYVRKDGTVLPVLVNADLVRDASGAPHHSRTTVLDDTDRRRREKEMISMADELARRSQAADAANRAKSAFLAAMSHEIRTPMNGILGMTHVLRRGVVTAKQADQLDKISHAGEHLLAIINDVLDLSKIEAGKIVLEDDEFARADFESQVLSLVAESARAKGLQLRVDLAGVPANLRGDRTRLQQALTNYLGNAIKFTERGTVTLSGRVVAETEADYLVRFEVADTGIGIAADALARLFAPFEQLETGSSRRFGGTGLGLAITRHLAALMGGAAGVSSVQGEGSTFWMTARLGKCRPEEHAYAAADGTPEAMLRRAHAGRRILVVEDEPLNTAVLCALLQDAGLAVSVAGNGARAVALARENEYAAILMDVSMPGMDGLEATRAIRALDGRTQTPIVAVTANAFDDSRQACLDAGMDDFLSKPVHPDILFATLLEVLGSTRR